MHTAPAAPATSGRADPSWQPETCLNPRNVALARALQQLEGRTGLLLEAGAGTARFLRAIRAQNPDLQGYACDMVARGLHRARQADQSLAVAQADLTALPYRSETFHTVLVFDVLEHLREPELGVREIARVLQPGGLFHALVPCEGQPGTLHWLMWKAGVAADLKERRVGHVQRFTHRSLVRLLEHAGFRVTDVSYSMHWLGQVKDILMHAGEGRHLAGNPLYRAVNAGLWVASYVESGVLSRFPTTAVVVHVTAIKR